MSMIEKIFIWMGGYDPRSLSNESPENREPIRNLGAAVLFATLVASTNWALAGWAYSEGAETNIRLIASGIAAIFGALIVLVFDRGFLYQADTADDTGHLRGFAYATFRVIVIFAVGSITSQAIMPLILGSEMRTHALHQVEASERERAAELGARYGIASKEADIKAAAAEVDKLREAVATIPVDIQRSLDAARGCWVTYNSRKKSLIYSGLSSEEAREKLSGKAAVCSRDEKAANAARDSYVAQTRTQLAVATDHRQTLETGLSQAVSAIKAKVDHARDIEMESLNPRSSAVLWSLLKDNPGARLKWLFVSSLFLVCELLPLISKFQGGQSNIGRRRAMNRALHRMETTERLRQREHDFAVSSAINVTSLQAIEEALRNPQVRAIFAQAFAANLAAYAPVEAVRAMMRDLEARHADMDDFMHRFPRYAPIISQAWSKAVRDTSEILARGVRVAPVNGVGAPA